MKTGQSRQVTDLTTQPQGATWSPDGKRIAFFNVDGMWRVAQMSVLDVASGKVTKVHDSLPQPGTPTWSPDGKRLALAGVAPMTKRFREGTNQILTMSSTAASRRRQVVRAGADAVDRFARRLRAGVVARRHQDGGDLRRRARGLAGVAGRRAARAAAARHQRERARAELAGRLAPHPLSVARQAADRRHRDRRDRGRCRST